MRAWEGQRPTLVFSSTTSPLCHLRWVCSRNLALTDWLRLSWSTSPENFLALGSQAYTDDWLFIEVLGIRTQAPMLVLQSHCRLNHLPVP